MRTLTSLALLAALSLPQQGFAQALGLPLDALRELHQSTASARATVRQRQEAAVRAAPDQPSLTPPAHMPRITPPARLPFDPEPVAPLVQTQEPPTPSAPVRVLNTSCSPFVRIARASQVTGSFLLDAPCLGGRDMLALFGDNPGHRFTIDEYGRAEFVFAAPTFDLFPLVLVDPASMEETLLHPFPDGPILIYEPQTDFVDADPFGLPANPTTGALAPDYVQPEPLWRDLR